MPNNGAEQIDVFVVITTFLAWLFVKMYVALMGYREIT